MSDVSSAHSSTDLPAGISGAEAVRRIWRLEWGAPSACVPEGPSIDAILRALADADVHAYWVRLRPGDAQYLDHPALLSRPDGLWWVTRGKRGNQVLIDNGGAPWVLSADVLEGSVDGAVEIRGRFRRAGTIWHRAWDLIRKRPRVLLWLGVLTVLLPAASLASPWLTRAAVDQALPYRANTLLALIAIGLFTISLAAAGWNRLRERCVMYLEARLYVELGVDVFVHLLGVAFPTLQSRNAGEALQALSGVQVVREFLVSRSPRLIADVATLVPTSAWMLAIMPVPALAALGAAGLVGSLTATLGARRHVLAQAQAEAQARHRTFLFEAVSAIATVKAFGSERRVSDRWRDGLEEDLALGALSQRENLRSDFLVELVRGGSLTLVLLYGGELVLLGQLSAGTLVAFAQLTASVLSIAVSTSQFYLTLVSVRGQIEPLRALLGEPSRGMVRARRWEQEPKGIAIEGVWFRYSEGGAWILRNFCLEVDAGGVRQIVGPSGWGKSTLLRLMAGLYTPQEGTVLIGGQDPARGGNLLYLPQSPRLVSGSIMDNLQLLSRGASVERVLASASDTGLAEWVLRLPLKYETPVGPLGASLSGGQRQLIALTAVLASDAAVLLLDEPMANLDLSTQKRLLFCSGFRGRTIVVAGHEESLGRATSSVSNGGTPVGVRQR